MSQTTDSNKNWWTYVNTSNKQQPANQRCQQPVQQQPAVQQQPQQQLQPAAGLVMADRYTQFQKDAEMLLDSDWLPDAFNVDNQSYNRKMANLCIAMEITTHFPTISPIQILNQIYFDYGKPAWKSSFILILLKLQGLKIEYEEEGNWRDYATNPRTRAIAKDRNGETYQGTWIDVPMVTGERWNQRAGSKWNTMPDQMARYRAATFLARAYWPEIFMGLIMADEQEDILNSKEE